MTDMEPESAQPAPPDLGLSVGLPVAIVLALLLFIIIAVYCCYRRRRKMGKLELSQPDEEQGLVKEVPDVRFEPDTNGLHVYPAETPKKTAKILASMEDLSDVCSVDNSDIYKPTGDDKVPLLIVCPPTPQRHLSQMSDIPLIDESCEPVPSNPDKRDKPPNIPRTPDKMADTKEMWDPDIGESPLNMKPLTTSTPYPVADVKRRDRPGRIRPEQCARANSDDVLASALPTNSQPQSEVWTESQVFTMLEDQEDEEAAAMDAAPSVKPCESQTAQQPTENQSEPSEPYITANSGDTVESK